MNDDILNQLLIKILEVRIEKKLQLQLQSKYKHKIIINFNNISKTRERNNYEQCKRILRQKELASIGRELIRTFLF